MKLSRLLIAGAAACTAVVAILAGMIIWTPAPLPPFASVNAEFEHIDYSGLPPIATFSARDGAALAYRFYPGGAEHVAVLVHGSTGNSYFEHPLAKALQAAGITVYALDMRGHGASGPRGDIGYIGQLDDDVADFMQVVMQSVRPRPPGAAIALVGFSAGGGFALRIAGGPYGALFDRYVLLAPVLRYDAPTLRPASGGWAQPDVPRIIALTILTRLGIHWFEGLPVVVFAVPPNQRDLRTLSYSARLASNFGPHDDYLGDVRRATKPIAVLVGANDEQMYADQYAPLLHSVRPELPVTILPGFGHSDMMIKPAAFAAITAAVTN